MRGTYPQTLIPANFLQKHQTSHAVGVQSLVFIPYRNQVYKGTISLHIPGYFISTQMDVLC